MLTEPPPVLPAWEELVVEVPVYQADGPCPERAGGGCWSGRSIALLRSALERLARYADDAWAACGPLPPKENP